jgi:hypothetical protein
VTNDFIERTVRDWVLGNPNLGARDLDRLAPGAAALEARTPEDIADALIVLAGRMHIAATRVW